MLKFFPVLFLLFSFVSEAAYQNLFIVERTTNRNRVVYSVDLAARNPVYPFWKMLAEDGHTEELTSTERSNYYGVELRGRNAQEVRFIVKSLPTYVISAKVRNGRLVATMRLAGRERTLRRVFMHLSGGLFPSVRAITIECGAPDEAASTVQLTPMGDDRWSESVR